MATLIERVELGLRGKAKINVLPWIPFVLVVTVLAIGSYVVWRATGKTGWATSTLAALASSAVGGLIGFLFGVPPGPGQAEGDAGEMRGDAGVGAGATPDTRRRGKNTALEEISSWLTRIIIGAGLVNLGQFTDWLGKVGGLIGSMAGLQPGSSATAFGTALILYFGITGFVAAYTYTRTTFSAVLADFDSVLLQDLSRKVDSIREDAQNERSAFDKRMQDLMESQMLSALYLPPPESYTRVMELADHIGSKSDELSPRASYYLACAYGQQLSMLLSKGIPEDRALVSDRAYAALQRAVQDRDVKDLARRLLRGELGEEDDDLKPFADEERFKRLVQ